MTTKEIKEHVEHNCKISQSLIEHHLQKVTYKILVKLRIIKQMKSFNHF